MVACSNQAKLSVAHHCRRLLLSPPSSRPPSSLSTPWASPFPAKAWHHQGQGERERKGKKVARSAWLRAHCASPLQQPAQTHETADPPPQHADQNEDDWSSVMCDPCRGRGWLLCDFCKGQKTNVKNETSNRIYRRCPSCKAVGYILCSNCKVFKCITFPDYGDGVM